MKLSIEREKLLPALLLVAGVVERRQTLPILANVLLRLNQQELLLTGTDLEVELQGRVALETENAMVSGSITVPARKLVDICRAMPEHAMIDITFDDPKLIVRSGRSRFSLATLPAHDFPSTEESPGHLEFSITQRDLRALIEHTQFAMAQQDVRYYLNGMLLEVVDNAIRTVATDGHRMAYSSVPAANGQINPAQIIVPRKGIQELSRLLTDNDETVGVMVSSNQLRVKSQNFIFTTKLIDARYPDYHKVIPRDGDKILIMDRDLLKQALSRVAVLSSEKHRSVRFELNSNILRLATNNPEQEEAEEELMVDYAGTAIETGFNVNYLIDALGALPTGNVRLMLSSPSTGIRIESESNNNSVYVVMPMQL